MTPTMFSLPPTGALPFAIPFGVAFNPDEFDPWTLSYDMFRLYEAPKISKAVPAEVNLIEVEEVYVYASLGSIFYRRKCFNVSNSLVES
jgi:hypothetical protein